MKTVQKYIPAFVLFIVLFLVKLSSYQYILPPNVWQIFAFFVTLDVLIHKIVNLGIEQQNFVNFYLGSMVVRMVFVLLFLGFSLYIYPDFRKETIIFSIVFYLFFTFFEISIILRKLRRF